ncbi:hypothetical protein Nepgr_000167 [Nepenthes gracilis]|uniref:Leucine-rich repeat-containing N-terminal plant-type domain-containing protein n=1 Tax=Nepenthes gracilis TaxID=150966 RepID=A0AAD3P4T8_NEPGR|nr:hypothetical protein Nepgr_000167 [Nepenthes gracilis]
MNPNTILSVFLYNIFFLFFDFSSRNHASAARHGDPTDRAALLEFKSGLNEGSQEILASWNNSLHFCHWAGVICGQKHQRVIGLDLEGRNLAGFISPHIGNLSFLRSLNLANNYFNGGIPAEVGHLFRLQILNISSNSLQGNVTVNLSHCSNLVNLALERNQLHGRIPFEFGSLSRLVTLSLHNNNLTGRIPSSIGNLSSLQNLLLFSNQLEGELPSTIAQLGRLKQFGVAANNLYGRFPPSLYNLSALEKVSLAYNRFHANLRHDIGLVLPKLQTLYLSTNLFTGHIPASLSNASGLTSIDISTNSFIGNVPMSLGYLQDLSYLNLEENLVGSSGYETDDLGFITSLTNCSNLELLSFDSNRIDAELPSSITNLSTRMTWLGFGSNYIRGSIPAGIAKLANLYLLSMEENFLTAEIPASIGELSGLQVLSLAANILTGKIPPSIGNISGLSMLLLNDNSLQGSIYLPSRNCKLLQIIDLSANQFNGTIPSNLFCQSSLSYVNMSENYLTGPLPPEVGEWTEQGTGSDVSTRGDVYSFGILLLEMFTGRRPTDEQFEDDLNLHNYVKMALSKRPMEIVDQSLLYNQGKLEVGLEDRCDEMQEWIELIASVFQVGLACSEENLRNRMKMEEATKTLVSIRDKFLSNSNA